MIVVGSKVRPLTTTYYDDGRIGIVKEIDGMTAYVHWQDLFYGGWYYQDTLELIEPDINANKRCILCECITENVVKLSYCNCENRLCCECKKCIRFNCKKCNANNVGWYI